MNSGIKKWLYNSAIENEIDFNECYIDYYDNTVAVLFLDIEIDFIQDYAAEFKSIDRLSSFLCSEIVLSISLDEDYLQRNLVDKKGRGIFLNGKDFKVFSDKKHLESRNNKVDRVLWVTRFFVQEKLKVDTKILEEWTQTPNLISNAKKIGEATVSFCVGNSVILTDLPERERASILSSVSICTYFYVVHDIINRNLKNYFIKLTHSKRINTSIVSRVNKTRSYIDLIENEFSDAILGLQGLRSTVSDILLDTWKYFSLVKSIERRKKSVANIVEFSIQERQGRYARLVEAILAGIGGVAILDFAVNMISFAHNENLPQDTIFGLVDIAQRIPPDSLFYSILFILLVILALVLRKR